jgi:hypothetical protein
MNDIPISLHDAKKAAAWLKDNFEEQIKEQIEGTFLKVADVCAIACKETAYKWIHWIDNYDPHTVLARCVFDASGEPEFPSNPRNAFPKNRFDFIKKYSADLLKMLVAEGNKTRNMQGWHDAPYLYKGYGIFQYDLQNIVKDEAFFSAKLWYNIEDCLKRLVTEINNKARIRTNRQSIFAAYNGSGTKAQTYGNDIITLSDWLT